MKIKTSELTGAALDWAVAKCEDLHTGIDGFWSTAVIERAENPFKYSSDWVLGGPIIEREKIETRLFADDGSVWYAHLGAKPFPLDAQVTGPTPLIAAMRCYCCSKLGDEVEVPDEMA